MPITNYAPKGIEVLEDLHIIVAPAIADLTSPTLAEIQAGRDVAGALREVEPGASASESDDKRLNRKTNAKRPGATEYSISDTTFIIEDPQAPDEFIDSLTPGAKAFVLVFPNIAPDVEIKAGDRAWTYESSVKTKVPGKLDTDDGTLFSMIVGWSVQEQELHSVVAAGE